MGGGPIKHLGLATCPRPVENLQVQVRCIFPQQAGHEIVHPERSVDPAKQVPPPVLECLRGSTVPVDRDIQKKPGLDVLAGFLHQFHPAGEGGTARIRRPAHGRLAHRFGEHVVAKGPQVPILEGLQVDDRAIKRPLPGGANAVLRETLATDLGEVPVQLGRGNHQRKADPLNSRIALGDF